VAAEGWRAVLPRKLLWVDCTAAALAGVAVLAFSGWLSRLYGLPRDLLLLIGAVNLLYGCYSFSLAVRARRPRHLIHLLVFANLGWAAVCLVLTVAFREPATLFGLAQLIGEAVFVGGLASLEWRYRDQLLTVA
jgi:hypothetical protein